MVRLTRSWNTFQVNPFYRRRYNANPECRHCGKALMDGEKVFSHYLSRKGHYKTNLYCVSCYYKIISVKPIKNVKEELIDDFSVIPLVFPYWISELAIIELLQEEKLETRLNRGAPTK